MTEHDNKLLTKILEDNLTAGEEEELLAMGILSNAGSIVPSIEAWGFLMFEFVIIGILVYLYVKKLSNSVSVSNNYT